MTTHAKTEKAAATMAIEAVTFDAYDTLFDLRHRPLHTIQQIVGDSKAEKFWPVFDRAVGELFHGLHSSKACAADFRLIDDIHRECLQEAAQTIGIEIDGRKSTDIWNRYIAELPLFDDVLETVIWCQKRWPTAIISDIDNWMLEKGLKKAGLRFDIVVTSEDDCSYKAQFGTGMFAKAVELLGISPNKIVHVGDGTSDVAGATSAGSQAVWLNRRNRPTSPLIPDLDTHNFKPARPQEALDMMCRQVRPC